jgi:Rrf2 family transcriptional regulator, cysteine metabolism repressor
MHGLRMDRRLLTKVLLNFVDVSPVMILVIFFILLSSQRFGNFTAIVDKNTQQYYNFTVKLTTKGKYAVSTMCELASNYGKDVLQAKDIARRHMLSPLYVEQILNKLKRAGLIKATRGPKGGYSLSRSPKLIKISEILEVTEGPISLVSCVTKDGGSFCGQSSQCKTKKFWSRLNGVIQNVLDDTKLADLC